MKQESGRSKAPFREVQHDVEVCVVGGGLSGVCAAIASARKGRSTLIIHDRPVFGGCSSREVRLHIAGAQERFTRNPDWNWKELRETGIIEEMRLANQRYNPQSSWPVWDGIIYDKVRNEPNLSFLLNCACMDAGMDGDTIRSVRGWQTINQTYHNITADVFVDCSGDSVLAPLTGAEYRYGREARAEFDESHAPEHADNATMGMTCLFEARDTGVPQEFIPPKWAKKLDEEDIPHRKHDFIQCGYAWIEYGGEDDTIHETDRVREELLAYVYGVWDHIKNRGEHGAETWALDWIQFLPGKRESRRLIGDYIMRQADVEKPNEFPDVVAYGGWSMDAHSVKGILYTGSHTTNHWTYAPYGIPYRSLYSRNITNLMFAGRNISATHMAMTSTRVQATCAIIGQAVGTAAALAAAAGDSPRIVGGARISDLQRMLLEDNCYLPGLSMPIPDATAGGRLTASSGDPEVLRNGVDRPVDEEENAWHCEAGSWVIYEWDEPTYVDHIRVVCDSDLNCIIRMNAWEPPIKGLPPSMLRDLRLDIRRAGSDDWEIVEQYRDNERRLIRLSVEREVAAARVHVDRSWGNEQIRLFAVTAHERSHDSIAETDSLRG
jgi:hypothetical protein